jgi:hypothetical protein
VAWPDFRSTVIARSAYSFNNRATGADDEADLSVRVTDATGEPVAD